MCDVYPIQKTTLIWGGPLRSPKAHKFTGETSIWGSGDMVLVKRWWWSRDLRPARAVRLMDRVLGRRRGEKGHVWRCC